MANRRMFAKDVLETDDFLELPGTSQLLYFWLGIEADDDGFVQPRRIMRMIGAKEDDLNILIARKFVIPCDDKVIVIKDWLRHNEIRADRYKPTIYQEHKSRLSITGSQLYTLGSTSGSTSGMHSIGEDRIEKDRLGQTRIGKDSLKGEGNQIGFPVYGKSAPVKARKELLNQQVQQLKEQGKL